MEKLSDYVMRRLAEYGVRHVFLLTGGGAMHLNDSLGKCKNIEYVCNLHEQACAFAAESYAKYNNRLGVAMVTVGPGATNAITGVAGGWLDSSPMLVLSGQVKRADLKGDSGLRNRGVQEVDIIPMVKSITKYAVTVTDPITIRYHLEKAVHLATSGRRGPVWLDIPLDVQASQIDAASLIGYTAEETPGIVSDSELKNQVAEVVRLLNKSERPLIVFGNGVRLANAQRAAEKIVETLGLPFGLTWMSMDMFPDSHPLLVGRPAPSASRGANFALQNSDFLLLVGARTDVIMTAFAPERLARGAAKVMVDIDPAELEKLSEILALPICADAGDFLCELQNQDNSIEQKDRSGWIDRCAEWKVKYPIVQDHHRKAEGEVSMFNFTEILCEELDEGDLVVPASSGNSIEILLVAFKAKAGQRVYITTGLGPMGLGPPASIGGCLASGGKRTVCVDGDGGFQLNIQEMETVARLNLPIKFFVINNGGYGSIVCSQETYFNRLTGANAQSGVSLPDITKVAAAYGLPTRRIENQENLREEIKDILDAPGPMVCEVMALPGEQRTPRVSSYQKPDGSMASKPLEDMWPFLEREEFLSNMIVSPIEV